MRSAELIGVLMAVLAVCARGGTAAAEGPTALVAPFEVDGDRIVAPLEGKRGDAERGKTVMLDPQRGNCGICHTFPGGTMRFQGDVGPGLTGVAGRLQEGQLRLRVVDGARLNPDTIMPPYHRVAGLRRVHARFAGRPVLTAGEVEDVVAYLVTLKE